MRTFHPAWWKCWKSRLFLPSCIIHKTPELKIRGFTHVMIYLFQGLNKRKINMPNPFLSRQILPYLWLEQVKRQIGSWLKGAAQGKGLLGEHFPILLPAKDTWNCYGGPTYNQNSCKRTGGMMYTLLPKTEIRTVLEYEIFYFLISRVLFYTISFVLMANTGCLSSTVDDTFWRFIDIWTYVKIKKSTYPSTSAMKAWLIYPLRYLLEFLCACGTALKFLLKI